MPNFKRFMSLFFLIILSQHALALSGDNFFASTYAASTLPSVQYCTGDTNPFLKDGRYQKIDISGPLPYIRNYNPELEPNVNRMRNVVNGIYSSGGWTDNYDNYMLFVRESNNNFTLQIKLPGEQDETFYTASSTDGVILNSINRIYSSMPLNYLEAGIDEKDGDPAGKQSANHRDKKIYQSSGAISDFPSLVFKLNQYGALSTFKYIKGTNPNVYLFRISDQSFPDGRSLGFVYDGFGGLTNVANNSGYGLKITRDYPDADLTKSTVKKVSLIKNGSEKSSYLSVNVNVKSFFNVESSGSDYSQDVEYKYKSYDWIDYQDNKTKKIYVITSSRSILNGYESYSYGVGTPTNYLRFAGVPSDISKYKLPILNKVYNSSEEEILNFGLVIYSATSISSVTKKSNGDNDLYVGSAGGSTSDLNSSTIVRYVYSELSQNNNYKKIRAKISHNNAKEYTDYTFTDYPCVTLNGVALKDMRVNNIYGYLDYVIDRNGYKTSFTYDSIGRIKGIIEAAGTAQERITSFEYTRLSNPSASVNNYNVPNKITKPGVTIENIISYRGQIESQTTHYDQPYSQDKTVKSWYYTNSTLSNYGLKYRVEEPRGIQTQLAYDNNRNLISITKSVDGKNLVKRFSDFNEIGQPTHVENPDGTVDDYVFSLSNNVIGHTLTGIDGYASAESYINDSRHGLPTSIGYSNGTSQRTIYDSLGRKLQETSPERIYNQYGYHPNGALANIKWAYTNYTGDINYEDASKYFYQNDDGYIAKEFSGSDESKNALIYSYDLNGNKISTTDSSGYVTQSTFDALNRVATFTDASSNIETYSYDDLDNRQILKDANGLSANYTFVDGKSLNSTSGTEFNKSYAYDTSGNLTEYSFVNRSCSSSGYDNVNRVAKEYCGLSYGYIDPTLTVTNNFSYDPNFFENIAAVQSAKQDSSVGVDTSYTYDGFGRVKSKTQTNKSQSQYGFTPSTMSVTYGRDDMGLLQSIKYPSGRTIDFTRDGSSRVKSVNLNGVTTALSIEYTMFGAIKSMDLNKVKYKTIYEKDQSVSKITVSDVSVYPNISLYSSTYDYHPNGLIKSITNGAGTYTYDYYPNYELKQEVIPKYTINYTYDKNGNRLSRTGLSSATYKYDGNKSYTLTQSGTSKIPSFDPETGTNLIDLSPNKANIASYDYKGRRQFDGGTGESSASVRFFMDYNHDNLRTIFMRTDGLTSGSRQFVYDEDNHLIGEYSLFKSPLVEYVWLDDKPILAIYGSGVNTKTYYIISDHNNTPRRLIDSSNNTVVWSWDSDAFGLIKPVGSIAFNLRFPGQYYDGYSGLFYNHNRYYNPDLGRYMEFDPLGLKAGANPYIYANNNPLLSTDPSGLILPLIYEAGIIAVRVAPIVGRYVYLNAPRIAAFAESLSPAAAGSIGAAAGSAGAAANRALQIRRAVPDGASTAFSYSSKATSRSSTQIQMTISQSKAIANLEANGFAKSFSQDGTRTILQKGDQTYRFYPEATSTLEPSAKLSIEGIKKPTATLRFPAK